MKIRSFIQKQTGRTCHHVCCAQEWCLDHLGFKLRQLDIAFIFFTTLGAIMAIASAIYPVKKETLADVSAFSMLLGAILLGMICKK